MAAQLAPIANWLLNAARQMSGMHGHPEFQDWAATLAGYGEREELRPLRHVLAALGADALRTPGPLQRFLQHEARGIPFAVYERAALVAEGAAAHAPAAAFALSLVALIGWGESLGDSLYEQPNGMPHAGWRSLPYACALAGMELGALDGARDLAAHAYDVLMSAKYYVDTPVAEALVRYRTLGRRIAERYETAVHNLADELRESTRGEAPNFRADVGAIFWTLGLVPESRCFAAGRPATVAAVVPSRRLCRLIVWRSLDVLRVDPLVQYLWLGLKDRPPLDIRSHRSLFFQINVQYPAPLLDQGFPVPTSRVYAETLTAWFRGDLHRDQAEEYLERFGLAQELFPEVDWSGYVRMELLAQMVGRDSGRLPRRLRNPAALRKRRYALVDMARSVTARATLHPEWPALHTRMNAPVFSLIEDELSGERLRSAEFSPAQLIAAVEALRAAGLSFWLHITPPAPGAGEAAKVAPSLSRESELLDQLRGAYFMMLYPSLPRRFRRYTYALGERDPIEPNPELGRRRFQELREELTTLYRKMRRGAPSYVDKRREPVAGLPELLAAIGSHALRTG
jgi:hypothetical protein